jgi:deoxyribodipyrimidine photo-lyase
VSTAVWWIRRDLRLSDNQALTAALARADGVVPVFVLDPVLLSSPHVGQKRVAFLMAGLRRLDRDLRVRGSRLVLRRGEPQRELAAVSSECGADALLAEEDFTPYARQRDREVAALLPLHLVGSCVVHPPGTVLKADGTPYTIFTPFARRWRALPSPHASALLPAPASLPPPGDVKGLSIPAEPLLPSSVLFPAGEAEGQRRLEAFAHGVDPPIGRYRDMRDRLDVEATSRLSPYLHLGMLSPLQAVVAALGAMESAPDGETRRGAEAWLNELVWREFFVHILYHFPFVLRQSFRPNLQSLRWENDNGDFASWCEGRTGYPVADAAMRQLAETGWMHNRARMIVASFLVKDLLVDWRWGERHFGQHLVDGDRASNNGGWQWTAGTGTDAAPYFRVFNPILQGKKHDPAGTYVRRWVPQLARVPGKFVHEPWKMPLDMQREVGCIIGQDYPEPIVEHRWARQRALATYARARSSE